MKTCLLVGLTAALLATACKKDSLDPNGLVPATQEGKNTGDFLLNGSPFSPQSRISSPGTKSVGASWGHTSRGGSNMHISFLRQEHDNNRTERLFDVFIANIRRPDTYQLQDLASPVTVAGAQSFAIYTLPFTSPTFQPVYLTGPTSPGQVIITRFDTVAHIVSGTFEAKLRKYQGSDSVNITQGRFDCTF